MNDSKLFETMRKELFTAVVGDVLDTMGFQNQFLPPEIVPLQRDSVLVGRALPVLEADVFASEGGGRGPLSNRSFGVMFEALDALKSDEIYIATGSSLPYALWGGLMSMRAMHLKAAGAVLDGFVRDSKEIERLGFTVFSRGVYAQDQGTRGKVIDYGCPIEISGIRVEPGSLLFGDREGMLVVPREVETEVVEQALDKARTESTIAIAIRDGLGAQAAFDEFGVM
jgi:4-hydroxy-4-methyl-2-oxoglutarate aldolase